MDAMSDAPIRVFLTGANRGIGLGYAREWLERGARVFASCRDLEGAGELRGLAEERPDRITVVRCDVADQGSVEDARRAVAEEADGLEVVINNAGVMGNKDDLRDLDLDDVRRAFEVNTLGPIRVTRTFLPLLEAGRSPRRLVHMTSLMGSIDDNHSGDSYAYRISKVGLNMASRSMAVDLADRGIVSVVVHPGWVRTDMGGSSARIGVGEAAAALVDTIEGLTTEDSGRFYDREGEPLPW